MELIHMSHIDLIEDDPNMDIFISCACNDWKNWDYHIKLQGVAFTGTPQGFLGTRSHSKRSRISLSARGYKDLLYSDNLGGLQLKVTPCIFFCSFSSFLTRKFFRLTVSSSWLSWPGAGDPGCPRPQGYCGLQWRRPGWAWRLLLRETSLGGRHFLF